MVATVLAPRPIYQGSIPGRVKRYLISFRASRLTMGSIEQSSQWVPGFFPRGEAVGA
jgi:hypothetical protein